MTADADVDDELFWEVVDPIIGDDRLVEGSIMQSRCVRAGTGAKSGKEFVAMAEYRNGNLVVKLPKARVAGLIEDGTGLPFAPAKRVFSEWVEVPGRDGRLWRELIEESITFANGGA